MPQAWLPLVPSGARSINDVMSVYSTEGRWFYFCGIHPVFFHAEQDRRSFRMYTSQMVCQGLCKQVDVIRTFGVSKNSVSRAVKQYQAQGAQAFFLPRKGRGASVLTEAVTHQAQTLLDSGCSRAEVAERLRVKVDTLRKAINQGRLSAPKPSAVLNASNASNASDKSRRTGEDAAAAAQMGTACTRTGERVLAAFGALQGAPTRFECARDVSFAGVLCALPALLSNGLLRHAEQGLETLHGYYTTVHVLILMAYMALCRISTSEQLQYHAPGELGKLLGLDRIPEVRCLRQKLEVLSRDGAPEKWSALLSKDWMEQAPELSGALYIDGHVRVYHGSKTKLPKRFVSRERLCLRGTTDYWINDALGKPFFVVHRPVDRGMLEVLRTDVIPRLLRDVPSPPSEEALAADPWLTRFVMIFDREGYSPSFFKEMWEKHRIACITYHKFPREAWPSEAFLDTEVVMPTGERLVMKLAERGSYIGDKKNGIWVREVRKLNKSGHQTSFISTAKSACVPQNAALIFSRWSQENFFGYMMKHYAIDRLCEYGTEEFPGNQVVINPVWRNLDRTRRSVNTQLTHRRARFAALELHPELDAKRVARWETQKAALLEEIGGFEHRLLNLKESLAGTSKHIDWNDLPDDDKFERLAPSRKTLVDTIKMIAYRAETALTYIVRETLARHDDARSLIRDLCRSEADILPDLQAGTLTIQLHHMANPRQDRALQHLLTHLNNAEFNYPGTNLRMLYRLAPLTQKQPKS